MGKFIIRRVPSGVKFDLKAPNGQTVLTSEVYRSLAACRKGIAAVQKNAPAAKVENRTAEGASLTNPKFELYQDRAGQFRFRLKARNGAIIAVSEPYAARLGCRGSIESVQKNAQDALVTEPEP